MLSRISNLNYKEDSALSYLAALPCPATTINQIELKHAKIIQYQASS